MQAGRWGGTKDISRFSSRYKGSLDKIKVAQNGNTHIIKQKINRHTVARGVLLYRLMVLVATSDIIWHKPNPSRERDRIDVRKRMSIFFCDE